jgi:hypothetical protein
MLPTIEDYPHLGPVIAVFDALGGTPEQVAQHLGFSRLVSCSKWLAGGWLEEYVLAQLLSFADRLAIESFAMDILLNKPSQRYSELDVAFMCGYQLFAISCMNTPIAFRAKPHLLELYVRARQLGGDEARFALVCCVENPEALQSEVNESWDAEGKIQVFGRKHLMGLSAKLEEWIHTASRL